MSKLYFEDNYGQRRLIGEPKTNDECLRMIHDFCYNKHFSIPYIRIWTTLDGEKHYDVSSHTDFFVEVK